MPNYSTRFSINIPRKGYFSFHSHNRNSEEYASRMVLEKPGCEFRLIQEQPGEGGCTVFSFSERGYELIRQRVPAGKLSFFTDHNSFSTVINSHAGLEYLHFRLLNVLRKAVADPFEIDCLVMEVLSTTVDIVLDEQPLHQPAGRVRSHHLQTMERAKEFLLEHFSQAVSLKELSRYCYVSEFHFTRMFKRICGSSPFEYLQQLRLKSAQILLSNTDLPISDVGFQSGFTRADYFSDAFTRKYGVSPRQFREKMK